MMKVLDKIMDIKKKKRWALIMTMVVLLCGAQVLAVIDNNREPLGNPLEGNQVAPTSVIELPVVRTIPLPGTWAEGLAFDGTWIWHADAGTDRIYRLDPTDGTVLDSISSPSSHPVGLDWYEGNLSQWHGLWNCDYDGHVYHVVSPLHSIPGPDSSMNGVVWIGDALWVSYFGSGQLHQIDPSTGQILGTMPAPGTSIRGMTIWKGDLWVVNSNYGTDDIYQLDPSDGTILGRYLPEGFTHDQFIIGLTAVGNELWVGDVYSRQALVLVPEPGTVLLVGLGGLALTRRRRQ